jgi:hypothetical protein
VGHLLRMGPPPGTLDIVNANEASELGWLRGVLETGVARAVRRNARLSLGDVARVTGFDRSEVSRYERAVRRPRSSESAAAYAGLLRRLLEETR